MIWNAGSGELAAKLEGHRSAVTSACFSPDGSKIVTSSEDKTGRVWDVASGEVLASLEGHSENVAGASFSADGSKVVTASWDGTARVWDAASGEMLKVLGVPGGALVRAVFAPDGAAVLAMCEILNPQLRDASSGALLCEIPLDVLCVGWSIGKRARLACRGRYFPNRVALIDVSLASPGGDERSCVGGLLGESKTLDRVAQVVEKALSGCAIVCISV